MEWIHIVPVNDKKPHKDVGLDCECEPEIEWEHQIVIHNSWDLREAEEFLREASDERTKG